MLSILMKHMNLNFSLTMQNLAWENTQRNTGKPHGKTTHTYLCIVILYIYLS